MMAMTLVMVMAVMTRDAISSSDHRRHVLFFSSGTGVMMMNQ